MFVSNEDTYCLDKADPHGGIISPKKHPMEQKYCDVLEGCIWHDNVSFDSSLRSTITLLFFTHLLISLFCLPFGRLTPPFFTPSFRRLLIVLC